MSYISFDYKCIGCTDLPQHRMVRRTEMDSQVCTECGSDMVKLPPATRTTFRFADTKLKE